MPVIHQGSEDKPEKEDVTIDGVTVVPGANVTVSMDQVTGRSRRVVADGLAPTERTDDEIVVEVRSYEEYKSWFRKHMTSDRIFGLSSGKLLWQENKLDKLVEEYTRPAKTFKKTNQAISDVAWKRLKELAAESGIEWTAELVIDIISGRRYKWMKGYRFAIRGKKS